MREAIATEFEEPAEDVLENESAVVADVGVVVDGGAAGVHGDFPGLLRDEWFGLVGERVVEANFHGGSCQQSAISSQEPFGMSK
jgi:hypothetical protein